jgi:predicted ester cyclase
MAGAANNLSEPPIVGLPGNGPRITFGMPHVFQFRDGLVSRENIWLDSAAIVDQLS